MQNLLSVLFYIRRNKVDKKGRVPIHMRVTYDGIRAEVSAMRKVELPKWNSNGNLVNGTSSEAKLINRNLDIMRNRVHEIHQKLLDGKEDINAIKAMELCLRYNDSRNNIVFFTIY